MSSGFYAWRGVDPDRIDAANVVFGSDRLTARGTSVAADYLLDWSLVTADEWVTRRLTVRLRGDKWDRSLDLERDDAGTWSARRDGTSLDPAGLEAATDCDLALCPFTNTMPVLRHDLVGAARQGLRRSVEFVMAWVVLPELTVEASPQRYTARAARPDGGALVDFESPGFATTIELDRDGIVREYPDLASRLHP